MGNTSALRAVSVLAVFVLMTAAVIVAALAVRSHFTTISEEAFKDSVEGTFDAVTEDVVENLAALSGIQGLFRVRETVSYDEFTLFVAPFLENSRGTQALEWIARVAEEDRERFQSAIRQEGLPDFSIYPESESREYFPVTYISPKGPNLAAFGFDLASNPDRLAALYKARDTGEMVATAPIRLVQETADQAGFLVFAPIYAAPEIPTDMTERRATLAGFALAVFRVDDFIDQAIPTSAHASFNLSVVDRDAEGLPTLIHSDRSAFPELVLSDGITIERTVLVADRPWMLQFSAPQGFGISGLAGFTWILVLIAGTMLNAFGVGFAYLLLDRRRTAEAHAKEMEQAFWRSEAARSNMMALSEDLIMTADHQGRIVFVSDAARSILGRDPSDMIGELYSDFIHPDDRDAVSEAAAAILRGEELPSLDVRFLRTDGGIAWLNWNGLRTSDPTGPIFAVGRDITERRNAETEIRTLARFPDENPNPVLRISKDGIIEYSNPGGAPILRYFGRDVGQAVPDDWRDEVTNALASGKSREIDVDCGDRVFSVVIAPVVDLGYVNLYGRDVTERREIEHLKDEFVSVVSHELKTPVTSIKGFLELIMERPGDALTVEQSEYLKAMERNTFRLEGLVNDLLDISRLEGGQLVLDLTVFDLIEAIDQVVSEMRADLESRHLTVKITSMTRGVRVRADQQRIIQVIANLLSNAIKYARSDTFIEVTVHQWNDGEGFVQVDVRDHGIGISEKNIGKLFQRFFRVDNSSTRSTPGTGLGLAITKALIELHGGILWVESKLDNGSAFSFTVPAA